MQSIYLLFIAFIYSINVSAQVDPITVNVDDRGQTPKVYPLAESYFKFSKEIKQAQVLSDTAQWKIEKHEEDTYVVKCKVYARSSPIEIDSVVQLLLILEGGDSVQMRAPVCVYADVIIEPYSGQVEGVDSNLLACNENVGFYAYWDYPVYVKKKWRLYGAYDIGAYFEDHQIRNFSGWYDTGDRTKRYSFQDNEVTRKLILKVNKVATIHRFKVNGKRIPIKLSESSYSEWRFSCDK